ncbi:MAG: YfgG family protein [Leclercia sp.]|uniref:YfgG family protein n=2 Tax=Silvania TaxID=3016631 RepID=A0A9J6QHY7_9ENTR|nr:YfgG family protein [Silvania hatchlandensis]MCU6670489.1 YfgG family protein [Silvania confinis]
MSQATRMRKRHRFNTRMTRIILLISLFFFLGRFVYSSIGAWYHHQEKKQAQQSGLSVDYVEPSSPKIN